MTSNITGVNATEINATVTGNETEPFNTTNNYSLDLTYTNNSVEETCSVIFSQATQLILIQSSQI